MIGFSADPCCHAAALTLPFLLTECPFTERYCRPAALLMRFDAGAPFQTAHRPKAVFEGIACGIRSHCAPPRRSPRRPLPPGFAAGARAHWSPGPSH
jgi:hypothetical protein